MIPYRFITSGGERKIRLLYSDNGSTWNHSVGRIRETSPYGINEVSIEELTNGDIYFNMRNLTASSDEERYRIVSKTTTNFWANLNDYTALSFDTELPEPTDGTTGCHASVLKIAATDLGDGYNQILFSNPASEVYRRFMTIRSSFDETGSWSRKKLLSNRDCAYSDMVMLTNGNVGILYETGDSYAEKIMFSWFSPNWLTDPEVTAWEFEGESIGSYATSSDTIYNSICFGLHGGVTGSIKYVAGPDSDKALEFTSGDYITIDDTIANNTLDFYEGETFWVEAKIKTTNHSSGGSSGSGAIIAKDWSAMEKSWWLRVQDGAIRFLICDGNVERAVTSSVTVTDGNWHTILAGRDSNADQVKVYVDGVLRGSVTDTTTASLKSDQNIRIGNFNNASRQFLGQIAYVRVELEE